MLFDFRYFGNSNIHTTADTAGMSFVPDALRTPTFFKGKIATQHTVQFREAISALHSVVTDDQRYVAPDKTEYLIWRKEQDLLEFQKFLAEELGIQIADTDLHNLQNRVQQKVQGLEGQLTTLYANQEDLKEELKSIRSTLKSVHFWPAVSKYYGWLWNNHKRLAYVLDPVISVHPDNLFFECFSLDEASYGKLSMNYDNFGSIQDFSCGTTNIDYSHALYNEFQKLRDYRTTSLEVDPTGFSVKTEEEDDFKEVKIDLPDSWVRGFLQVSTSMALPATKVRLHPLDVHGLCLFLRKHKELKGPRSLRFHLKPNQPVRVSIDPWNVEFKFARSVYEGPESQTIRVWGRRRIHILERLVPIANHFDLYLLGTGQPYFFVADLGTLSFSLGLSGWSANNFSEGTNFGLLAPRGHVDLETQERVFNRLKKTWFASVDELVTDLSLERSTVVSALTSYIQAGRAVYDLSNDVYRARELSRDPLPMDALRFSSPQEAEAIELLNQQRLNNVTVSTQGTETSLSGHAEGVRGGQYRPEILLDDDGRISTKSCNCALGSKNKICAHILALRLHHTRSS